MTSVQTVCSQYRSLLEELNAVIMNGAQLNISDTIQARNTLVADFANLDGYATSSFPEFNDVDCAWRKSLESYTSERKTDASFAPFPGLRPPPTPPISCVRQFKCRIVLTSLACISTAVVIVIAFANS